MIPIYAPELNEISSDYPADAYAGLAEIEARSFWFIWRNRIIQHFFRRHVGTGESKVLEIGCGTGFVMKGLSENFPLYAMHGADIHVAGMEFAQNRLPHAKFFQLDASQMPFTNEFSAVGMFDSLEHISDDEGVIRGVHQALESMGLFLITVPQYQFLWSHEDDLGGHKRRYSRLDLCGKLQRNGFRLLCTTSFVSTLFPLLCVTRLIGRMQSQSKEQVLTKAGYQLAPPPLLNSLVSLAMGLDYFLIRLGIFLPFGGSLLVVAQKT